MLKTEHVRRDPAKLKRLEVNARFMRKETFDALVVNLRQDGVLTDWPLIWREPGAAEGRELILSGNHRVDAAQTAELGEIDAILLDAPDMTTAERIARQLSHNAIAGEDDPVTLKQLYEQIEDVDWRGYAGLDDKTLKLLAATAQESLAEANLDFATIQLLFLPPERDAAETALKAARERPSPTRCGWPAWVTTTRPWKPSPQPTPRTTSGTSPPPSA